jgi:hypothetical protein
VSQCDEIIFKDNAEIPNSSATVAATLAEATKQLLMSMFV